MTCQGNNKYDLIVSYNKKLKSPFELSKRKRLHRNMWSFLLQLNIEEW